jgi:hypothetical protein
MLDGFKGFCTKTYIEDVERQDLLDFATHLKKEGASHGVATLRNLVNVARSLANLRRYLAVLGTRWDLMFRYGNWISQ